MTCRRSPFFASANFSMMTSGTAPGSTLGTAVGSSHPLASAMTTLAPDKAASKIGQQAIAGFKYPSRNGIFESLGLQRQRQVLTPLQHKPRRRTALDKHRRFLSQLQHSVWRGKVTLMQQRVLRVQVHACESYVVLSVLHRCLSHVSPAGHQAEAQCQAAGLPHSEKVQRSAAEGYSGWTGFEQQLDTCQDGCCCAAQAADWADWYNSWSRHYP